MVTALEHLGRVWDSPPPDRAGVGTLADRFKTIFDSAIQNDPGLQGKSVDQIVDTVAGPGATASLNASYAKVRRAYQAKVAAEALPEWQDSSLFKQLNGQRKTVMDEYHVQGREMLETRGAETRGMTTDTFPGYLRGYAQRMNAQKETHDEQLNELMDLGSRYMVNFSNPSENFNYSDQLMAGGYAVLKSYEDVVNLGDFVSGYSYNPSVGVVDYKEMGKSREHIFDLENQLHERIDSVVSQFNGHPGEFLRQAGTMNALLQTEFRMLGVERDLKVARLDDKLSKGYQQFQAARRAQVEAAQQAYDDALAELDVKSKNLVARFDQGSEVEYTLDATVTSRPFDDLSSGCMQSVANGSVKCGRELASDLLNMAIEARDSKSGKFYQELRKVLAKPEDQLTVDDKIGLAESIRELFGDKAGGFGRIADGLLKGKKHIDNAVGLAKKIDSIINRDPNDPLAELKAFKTYLGLGQKFANLVPGMGKMFEQYVEALDGIIVNAKVISKAKIRSENSTQIFSDVIEGIYRKDKENDNSEGAVVFDLALNTLHDLDKQMLNGEVNEGWKINKSGETAILNNTKVEGADYDKAREVYEKVIKQQNKNKNKISDAVRVLDKILINIRKDIPNPTRSLTGDVLTPELKAYGQARNAFTALHEELNSNTAAIILKRTEPGYLDSLSTRITEVAAHYPDKTSLKELVSGVNLQRKTIVEVEKDLATASLILHKAEKRYVNKLNKYTALALANRDLRRPA